MAQQTFSSFEKFSKAFPELNNPENSKRLEALKSYFENGGVLRIEPKGKGKWPSLAYPTKSILKKQINEKSALKRNFEAKKREWQLRLLKAQSYHAVHSVKKFSSPLYWQHMAKYATDKEYKKAADKVKLPAHLVTDERWEPMVRMFVHDDDYRKQLTETVENSVVYKNDRRVARFADSLQDFRKDESIKRITELQKKVAELEKTLSSLKEINRWATA